MDSSENWPNYHNITENISTRHKPDGEYLYKISLHFYIYALLAYTIKSKIILQWIGKIGYQKEEKSYYYASYIPKQLKVQ